VRSSLSAADDCVLVGDCPVCDHQCRWSGPRGTTAGTPPDDHVAASCSAFGKPRRRCSSVARAGCWCGRKPPVVACRDDSPCRLPVAMEVEGFLRRPDAGEVVCCGRAPRTPRRRAAESRRAALQMQHYVVEMQRELAQLKNQSGDARRARGRSGGGSRLRTEDKCGVCGVIGRTLPAATSCRPRWKSANERAAARRPRDQSGPRSRTPSGPATPRLAEATNLRERHAQVVMQNSSASSTRHAHTRAVRRRAVAPRRCRSRNAAVHVKIERCPAGRSPPAGSGQSPTQRVDLRRLPPPTTRLKESARTGRGAASCALRGRGDDAAAQVGRCCAAQLKANNIRGPRAGLQEASNCQVLPNAVAPATN